MYYCAKCKRGVLVKDLLKPIRACKCTRLIEIKPEGWFKKFLSLLGKKYYKEVPEKIIVDFEGTAIGKADVRI
jgi:hypothetical protein